MDNDKFGQGRDESRHSYRYGSASHHDEMQAAYEKEMNAYQPESSPGSPGSPGSGNGPAGMGNRKRGGARPALAAFLAGALVIGAFMYGADRANLFTGGNGSGGGAAAVSSAQQDAGIKTASSTSVEESIADIYAKASPAVVKIENYSEPQQSGMMDDPYFRQFFGDSRGSGRQQEDSGAGAELELTGEGSGFFFDKSGYILTNQHVIAGAGQVKVTVEGYDEPLVATIVGSSEELDLAVLKVKGDGDFPTLSLGDSDHAQIGSWVIAIGNPYGFDHSMTVGVLSAKERPITISDEEGDHTYEHLLQTDASINPGNSGGPLLNASGEVIGINTAVNSEAQGIGFAIPTSTIKDVLKDLMSNSL